MSLTAPPQIPSTVPRRFRCCLSPQAGKTPTKHGVWRTSSSADLADKRRNLKPCLYQHVASAAVPEPIAHEPAVNRLVLTTEPQDPYERHIQDTATYSVHLAHRQLRCLISDTHDPQLDPVRTRSNIQSIRLVLYTRSLSTHQPTPQPEHR
jgi:hypothetical protein